MYVTFAIHRGDTLVHTLVFMILCQKLKGQPAKHQYTSVRLMPNFLIDSQLMVRSRSLNSPMMNCAAAASSSGPSRGPRWHNSGGGDSKLGPTSQVPSPRRLRGDPGLVSMEQCSARLSMRQALFGLSPSTSQASGSGQTNNPNQGPSEPNMGSLASNTSSITRDKNSSSQITPTSNSKDSRSQRTQKAMIWSETEACKRQV